MSTVALKHCRALCLILRGAAEGPILTTFRRWPHWRRVEIVRDLKNRAGCLAVTFITDQYAEPMVPAMRKRTFASICPDVEHVSRLRASPPSSDQNPRRRCVPCFDAVQPRAYSVAKRTSSSSTSS